MGFQESLIMAVMNNPVIYDKNLSSYKNLSDREIAWKTVGKELKVKDILMLKRRWRTLRDAFIKQYRVSKLYEAGQTRQHRRTKWHYYDNMMFLAPHIESKRPPKDSCQEDSLTYQYSQIAGLDLGEDSPNVDFHEGEDVSAQSSSQPEGDSFKKYDYSLGDTCVKQYFTESEKKKHLVIDDKIVAVVSKQDADEQFMLSCVPILKRLSTRNNMLARMQIQTLLFDLEFGHGADTAQRGDDVTGHSLQTIKCEDVEVDTEPLEFGDADRSIAAPKNMPDSSQLIPTQDTEMGS